MPLQLLVIAGPSLGLEFAVRESGAFLVGRSVGASFSLRAGSKLDTRISKRHALVEFNSPHCKIHRISDKNQLLLNGNAIEAANLRDGDRVSMGKTTFQVRLTPPVDPPTFSVAETAKLLNPSPAPIDQSSEISRVSSQCPLCGRDVAALGELLCSRCQTATSKIRQPLPAYLLARGAVADTLGQTFLGVHRETRKAVTVRIIHPASILPTPVSVAFLRELHAYQQVTHRHLGRIEEFGLQNGQFFVSSKWIRGRNLIGMVKKRALKPGDAIGITIQILSALKAIHKAKLVHGHLHPRNVFVRMNEKNSGVKLADAGIGLAHQRLQIGGCVLPSEEQSNFAFMAPEQLIDSHAASPFGDQYSAAAILYYLLSGRRIYRLSKEPRERIIQKLRDEPTPLREHRPDLPSRLISTVHCALSRDPKRRFADVKQFRAALRELLN